MTRIDGIKLSNSGSRQNVKNILGLAVKNRKGSYNELLRNDTRRGDTIESFMDNGYIKISGTSGKHMYKITETGDQYYKDIFGTMSYWRERLSGEWKRFLKRHI